ncbi:hypothetical protein ACFSKL_07660 [Belliella marina]|uniref:Uncharacterized protein n=1 Tax=Belliella marina TaxID=1644146 RepID=A0ABW4VL82_9BACT
MIKDIKKSLPRTRYKYLGASYLAESFVEELNLIRTTPDMFFLVGDLENFKEMLELIMIHYADSSILILVDKAKLDSHYAFRDEIFGKFNCIVI